MALTSLSQLIQDLLIEGYTLPEIAEQWGISKTHLTRNYTPIKKHVRYYGDMVEINQKSEPYHENEFMYGSTLPQYKWSDLNKNEIKAYYIYKLKNAVKYAERDS